MKNTLTLSAVLFALTLAPAAFANGTQEQTQASPVDTTPAETRTNDAETTPLTRSVLERLDAEVRAKLLSGLRESSLQMLQVAAPVLVEATNRGESLELTSR